MEKKEVLEAALNALDRLLRMFMAERYIYLILSVVSFVLLLYAGHQVITESPANTEIVVSLFGSGGLIAVSSVRITWFFNRSFTLIENLIKDIAK